MQKIGVIGANGLVGQIMVEILSHYQVEIVPLGLSSAGQKIKIGDQYTQMLDARSYDYSELSGAVMSVGSEAALEYREKMKHGWLIDNSEAFRQDAPLVVPEIYQGPRASVIASPNCVAIPIALVLYAMKDLGKIISVVGSSYQSVSGAGKKALIDYQNQAGYYDQLMPQIGDIQKGISTEERKIVLETQQILQTQFPFSIMAVRVPVARAHGVHLHIQFDHLSETALLEVLQSCPYIHYQEVPNSFEVYQSEKVHVGRVRVTENALDMWIVSDNLYRGAAWNVCEIAKQMFGLQERVNEQEKNN